MMDPASRIEEIFWAALNEASAETRAEFLERACGKNTDLRREIEHLVAASERAGGFLESPAVETIDSFVSPSSTESQLGPYKLRSPLGEGGMGIVYLAEQETPVRRDVALKVIRPERATSDVIARFQAERQVLAMMDHPNIASIFDAGSTSNGTLYFAMELVDGAPIDEFCDQHKFDLRQRIELMIQVCQAVQHAHQKGVIHRDLKPSNVLVRIHDQRAMSKVIDFGIAKAMNEPILGDETHLTKFAQVVGTPRYMSPEQACLDHVNVDTRSDVYALGVILYELLSGESPLEFDRNKRLRFDEIQQMIREQEPLSPSRRVSPTLTTDMAAGRQTSGRHLRKALSGECDWIALKALDKDPTRRYQTAAELADDLQRFLDDQPVTAARPTTWYRLTKFARRNTLLLGSTVVILATILIGAGVSLFMLVEATAARRLAARRATVANRLRIDAVRERNAANEAKLRAQKQLYRSDMKLASDAWHAGDIPRTLQLLRRHEPARGEPDLRGFEWHFLAGATRPMAHSIVRGISPVTSVGSSPNGLLFAVGSVDGRIRVFRPPPHRASMDVESSGAPRMPCLLTLVNVSSTNGICWFPDGRRLVSAHDDGKLRVWDLPNFDKIDGSGVGDLISPIADVLRRSIRVIDAHQSNDSGEIAAHDVVVTPDGESLVSCGADGTVRRWDAETGELLGEFAGHSRSVEAIAVTADGSRIVSASSDSSMCLWNIDTGAREFQWQNSRWGRILCTTISADDQLVAGGTLSGLVIVVDLVDGSLFELAQPDSVETVAFHPTERLLLSGDRGGAVQVREFSRTDDGRVSFLDSATRQWNAHDHRVQTIGLHHGGHALVTGSRSGQIALWSLEAPSQRWVASARGATFDADNHLVLCDQEVFFLDVSDRQVVHASLPSKRKWELVASAADVPRIAVVDQHSIAVYDRAANKEVATWQIDGSPAALAISPDGCRVAAAWYEQTEVRLFDAGNLSETVTLSARQCRCLEFSPDGTRLAVGRMDDALIFEVTDLEAGSTSLVGHRNTLHDLAFSPDGSRLATVSHDRNLRLWDLEEAKTVYSVPAHKRRILGVCFSADGRIIATCGDDRLARLWHAETGQPLMDCGRFSESLQHVGFSPSGTHVVVQEEGGRVHVLAAEATARQATLPLAANLAADDKQQRGTFIGLGILSPDTASTAYDLSADGRVVVGTSTFPVCPFRWTNDDGMQALPMPDQVDATWAIRVADDGRTVWGYAQVSRTGYRLVRWQPGATQTLVGEHDSFSLQLNDAVGETAVLSGFHLTPPHNWSAFLWNGDIQRLPTPESFQCAAASAIATSGQVIGMAWRGSGAVYSTAIRDMHIAVWRDGQPEILRWPRSSAYNWWVHSASGRGDVIVGCRAPQGLFGDPHVPTHQLAFRWERNRVTLLGDLPGGAVASTARAVAPDGSLIVGSSSSHGNKRAAFLWDERHGMRSLSHVLEECGAEPVGWHLDYGSAVTVHEGQVYVVGAGRHPKGHTEAFLARIPETHVYVAEAPND